MEDNLKVQKERVKKLLKEKGIENGKFYNSNCIKVALYNNGEVFFDYIDFIGLNQIIGRIGVESYRKFRVDKVITIEKVENKGV